MFPLRPLLIATAGLCPGFASAEVPRVVADTAPVHSLVSMVMGELAVPTLLIPAGTSPHHASLRPADAAALTEADLVIWTGPTFAPGVGDAAETLAPAVPRLALLATEGWAPIAPRAGGHEHDDESQDHAGHEDQDHGPIDPHAWLDPSVAAAWVTSIETALASVDPDHAPTYASNAESARRELSALALELSAVGAVANGRTAAVGHDAYAYFERAAGLNPSVPLGLAEGGEPRASDAAHLAELAGTGDVACLVLDAESGDGWGEALGLRTVRADPDGVFLTPGPDLYPALIRDMADAFTQCFGP